jgi:acetyl-CoA/propionyl-CoA carboxylase biotin carboxyl carrier protein
VPQSFDSLIGKLIVTGADREQALQRSRRALAEFTIGGMPTVLPFHRAVVNDPAFTGEPFTVFTRWIETEFTGELEPQDAAVTEAGAERSRLTVEVGGKRLEVTLPAALGLAAPAGFAPIGTASAAAAGGRASLRRARAGGGMGGTRAHGGDSLVTPMQGTIVKIVAAEGQQVSADDTVVVLEAMKMEQPLKAHKAGTVTGLAVEVGQTVTTGTEICQIKD